MKVPATLTCQMTSSLTPPCLLIRNSGKVKDKDGKLNFSLCMIPDRTYARVYEACVADFKEYGAIDVSNIGSVANVGLMAKKAEEYGSHDKTFIAKV